jgi:hypothetical protein
MNTMNPIIIYAMAAIIIAGGFLFIKYNTIPPLQHPGPLKRLGCLLF